MSQFQKLNAGMIEMHTDQSSGLSRQIVVFLTFTAAVMVSAASFAGTTVLIEQPTVSGIAKNIFVAHVAKSGMPTGSFDLVVEQPDPFTSTGNLVTTTWDAGSQTGFTPTSPATAQLGFRNLSGTSTAQMEGDVVGAYLNSKDLPTELTYQKMMTAPQYTFPSGTEPMPFESSTALLSAEMDLQIPVATGSDTYIDADFLFIGPNGLRVTYGVKLFNNGARGALFGVLYDTPDNVFIINCPLETNTQFLTKASTSGSSTGTPWLGWKHFQWSINQAQFVAGLKQLAAKFPAQVKSTDPNQYVFSQFHLNAEFHYSPAPAELGWSMRGLNVSLTD
jgi:hypothetical protein